jgi:lipopolysaccharide biosynthesis glycosyltransferase
MNQSTHSPVGDALGESTLSENRRGETIPDESPDMHAMVLVLCSDRNYAMPLCVTICSIVVNHKPDEHVVIYLLDGGMLSHDRERLLNCVKRLNSGVRIIFYAADIQSLNNIKQVGFYGVGTYIRLLIPTLLPASIEKIMFLDSDLIIRASVAGLWNQPLDHMPVAAIQDQYMSTMDAQFAPISTYRLTDLDPKLPYVNAGVTVWDLKLWRTEYIAEAITQFLHDYADKLKWADQDGLNVVLAGRIKIVEPRWNYQYNAVPPRTSWAERRRRMHEAYIVHYTGPDKPWTPGVIDPERIEFLKYLRLSGWMSDFAFVRLLAAYVVAHIWIGYLLPCKHAIKRTVKRAIIRN